MDWHVGEWVKWQVTKTQGLLGCGGTQALGHGVRTLWSGHLKVNIAQDQKAQKQTRNQATGTASASTTARPRPGSTPLTEAARKIAALLDNHEPP
jgi:hypothetical protein